MSESRPLKTNPDSNGFARFARDVWDQAGMLLVLVVVFLVCSASVNNFLSWMNMNGLALSVSTIGMISCTMLFCLASGDFDLSIGSVVACAGVLAAVVTNRTGSVAIGMISGVLGGGLVGLVNGVIVARLRINALITTLASMQIVRGFSYMISGGKAVGVAQESFYSLGNWSIHGITAPVWYALASFIFFGLLLRSTIFGRNTLAIGGNREAARLAGIHVERTKIVIFTMQGLMAAFAGVVLASRLTSGQPGASQGLELEVISACVLGGVSLAGGVGSMLFVIAGVLIMGIVQNAMNLANVPTFYQYVARGVILLIAVILDEMKRRTRSS